MERNSPRTSTGHRASDRRCRAGWASPTDRGGCTASPCRIRSRQEKRWMAWPVPRRRGKAQGERVPRRGAFRAGSVRRRTACSSRERGSFGISFWQDSRRGSTGVSGNARPVVCCDCTDQPPRAKRFPPLESSLRAAISSHNTFSQRVSARAPCLAQRLSLRSRRDDPYRFVKEQPCLLSCYDPVRFCS